MSLISTDSVSEKYNCCWNRRVRGCHFVSQLRKQRRTWGIPFEFNISFSWFFCSRTGCRWGNDLWLGAIVIHTYCSAHGDHAPCLQNNSMKTSTWQKQDILMHAEEQNTWNKLIWSIFTLIKVEIMSEKNVTFTFFFSLTFHYLASLH